jgi:hypothetical protein
VELGADTKAVLVAAGSIFLLALVLGVWKYKQIYSSPDHLAHHYVDTAHRAALLYSSAALLIAVFVQFSGFSTAVNLIAAGGLIFFFIGALVGYVYHGLRRDTTNQFADPMPGLHGFMIALIVVEIGGFAVLFAGFLDGQVL